jgi:hypothetical protein
MNRASAVAMIEEPTEERATSPRTTRDDRSAKGSPAVRPVGMRLNSCVQDHWIQVDRVDPSRHDPFIL